MKHFVLLKFNVLYLMFVLVELAVQQIHRFASLIVVVLNLFVCLELWVVLVLHRIRILQLIHVSNIVNLVLFGGIRRSESDEFV